MIQPSTVLSSSSSSSGQGINGARVSSDQASLLQAASDIQRTRLARQLLVGASSQAPVPSVYTQLGQLPGHGIPVCLGGGLSDLQAQVSRNPALVNGIVGRPQNIADILLLNNTLGAGSNGLLLSQNGGYRSQTVLPGGQVTTTTSSLPAAALASLSAQIPNLLNPAPRSKPASAQDVHDAIASLEREHGTAPSAAVSSASALSKPEDGSGDVHPPVLVYMECDEDSLSDYQCLLRKQIELFEATSDDVQWNAQGRNKAIVSGQVGIRCRYCARLPTWSRARGAVYYSATLDGLYQAAQNMAKNHLCRHCRLIPEDTRQKLMGLRDCKRRAAGGKKYWGEGARVLGVRQGHDGLRFRSFSNNNIAGAENTTLKP